VRGRGRTRERRPIDPLLIFWLGDREVEGESPRKGERRGKEGGRGKGEISVLNDYPSSILRLVGTEGEGKKRKKKQQERLDFVSSSNYLISFPLNFRA